MRGRPSKPTALKALEGNAGHRSLDERGDEPAPAPGVGAPPAWLGKVAKQKWFELVAQMGVVHGWLTEADHDLLTLYCSAWARFVEAEVEIPKLRKRQASPRTTGEERGQILNEINLYTGQRKQAEKDMKTTRNELGLSPSSRTRIRINPGQGELPLDGENVSPFTQAQNLARG